MGVEGTEVVLQIEKGSSRKILTITCMRKWVESSANEALHDHSTDSTSATLVMRTDSPATAYSYPQQDDDRVLAGILGGVTGATGGAALSNSALYNSAASARSHSSNTGAT